MAEIVIHRKSNFLNYRLPFIVKVDNKKIGKTHKKNNTYRRWQYCQLILTQLNFLTMNLKTTITVILMALCAFTVTAQEDEYSKDILKMLSINGSEVAYDAMYDQLTTAMKMQKAGVPDATWGKLKTEVFDAQIVELNKKMVPIYKQNLSHADVKEIIKFYESEVGKKLAASTSNITKSSMQMSQQWAMQLMGKMNEFLTNEGY